MLRLSKVGLYMFLLILLFSGCKLDSFGRHHYSNEVDNEFYIDMWENLSPDSRSFVLKIRTIDNQECVNSSIDAALSVFQSTLSFLLKISKTQLIVSRFPTYFKRFGSRGDFRN